MAGPGPGPEVFVLDPHRVLNRHFETRKRHDLRSESHVGRLTRGSAGLENCTLSDFKRAVAATAGQLASLQRQLLDAFIVEFECFHNALPARDEGAGRISEA